MLAKSFIDKLLLFMSIIHVKCRSKIIMSFEFKSDRRPSSQTGFQTDFSGPIQVFRRTIRINFSKSRRMDV